MQHIEEIASSEDWQKLSYQIARTLVDAQYEITHRQIIEKMKVDNLDEMESDDDILAAALKITSLYLGGWVLGFLKTTYIF